jgi:hypothetical protein
MGNLELSQDAFYCGFPWLQMSIDGTHLSTTYWSPADEIVQRHTSTVETSKARVPRVSLSES